jgi:hypothetical protein
MAIECLRDGEEREEMNDERLIDSSSPVALRSF